MTDEIKLCGSCSKKKKEDALEGEEFCKCGRPTKYEEEYINKVDEYLAINQDEFNNSKLKVKLPTIEGFALYIGVNKHALYDWEKEYIQFSHALDKIRTEQKQRLLNMGLSGDYNSTIAKLVLSANHGMSEKSEIDHTSKGEKIVNPANLSGEELKEAIKDVLNNK